VFTQARSTGGWVAGKPDSTGQGCRDQEWYAAARSGSQIDLIHWSNYGILPGDGRQGLVAARSVGGTVLALGLLKSDLDRFAATAPITENGILVRRYAGGQIVWLSPRGGSKIDVADSGQLLVSGQPEHAVIGDPGELGLIAPAGDLSRRLETVTGKVMILFGILLALAMITVVVLAFDYRNKWQRFSRRRRRAPEDPEALGQLIAEGEGPQVEFKSTLRWNLHSGKPGKEIELAWLKTVVAYLNTDGGFLLIGVADDGQILGLEADQFANDDKFLLHFDNLIKQHVGLEFASYLNAGFREVDGGRVFLISCDRCPEPVFLKSGDEEKFFIRLGPSTRQLPGSKILDYLEERYA
jgi:hypothetical protein